MWKMTLKQRRRHSQLMARLEAMKQSPYLKLPKGYKPGEDPAEDQKYREAQEAFMQAAQEVHAIEEAARQAT